MTIRGHIENGRVVLDEPIDLPDGTPVRVEPAIERDAGPARGTPAALLDYLNEERDWVGPPGELERLLEDVQRQRDSDLESERDRDAAA